MMFTNEGRRWRRTSSRFIFDIGRLVIFWYTNSYVCRRFGLSLHEKVSSSSCNWESHYRPSTVAVGTVALNNPAHCSLGVFGFSSARRRLLNSPSSTTSLFTSLLNAATIDAAEVLDSSSISDNGSASTQKANYVGDCDDTDEDCLLFQALLNTLDSVTADVDSIATRTQDISAKR